MMNTRCFVSYVMALFVSAMALAQDESARVNLLAQQASKPDARDLVNRFQTTLRSQQRFLFEFVDTGAVRHRASSSRTANPQLEGDRTYHMSGTLASDGHRVVFRSKTWGQYNGLDRPAVEKSDAQYNRDVYDGKEMWFYFRPPRQGTKKKHQAGSVGIKRGRSPEWISKIVGHKSPTHWLQGYLSERGDRLDTLLRNARLLTVREDRETVGGYSCHVVDFSSTFGRGTLWFDPARGCLLAQAEVFLGAGHYLPNGESLAPGYASEYRLSDVTLENVDGVWFATGATVVSDITFPGARERRTNRPRISSVRLNPNLDTLGLFTTEDIEDGASVGYIGRRTEHVWQGGRAVRAVD